MSTPSGILDLFNQLTGFFSDLISNGINWFRNINISILWSWLPADLVGVLGTLITVLCFIALIHIVVKLFGMIP